MLKIIKETMIMLLVCLVGILLFAVIFYEYIPAKKEVAEVTKYSPTSTVSEQLSDSVDNLDENVVSTFESDKDAYQVTSTDLNRYQSTKEYVPGKSNPFDAASTEPEGEATNKKSGTSGNSSSKSGTDNNSKNNTSKNTNDEKSPYIRDKGIK